MTDIIRKIIREQIDSMLESFEMKNDNKSYIPTDEVAKTAKAALDSINIAKQKGINLSSLDGEQNQGSGKLKARQLSHKIKQSFAEMKRLKSFFESNSAKVEEVRKNLGIIQQRKSTIDEMTKSNILLVWNLHGGDAGKKWVTSKLSDTHEDGINKKKNYRAAGGNIEVGEYKPNRGFGSLEFNHSTTNHRIHK